jgi:tRNA threonylcarbamoyladenosine biosynthesis protein TsaE
VIEREIISRSAEETIQHGRELAAQLRPPILVLLSGDLGAGKTTLTKGLISGLGAAREEDVTSPTFTLVHAFRNHVRVYHVDLYRISDFADLETLGLEDILAQPAVVIVEWPDKLTLRTDWPVLKIRFEHVDDCTRRISIAQRSGAPLDAAPPEGI